MGFQQLYRGSYGHGTPEKGQAGAAITGTIAAGLAADGSIWTLRYPAIAPAPAKSPRETKRLYVQRIHVQYTCGTAFGTPVTLGRHLKLVRGAPATTASDPSGGAAYTMVHKRSDDTQETLAIGRIATTAALTTTGFTFETNAIKRMLLSQAGASGNSYDEVWRYDGVEADPIYLLPGEVLAIQAGATFDASGTFELAVSVDAVELIGV